MPPKKFVKSVEKPSKPTLNSIDIWNRCMGTLKKHTLVHIKCEKLVLRPGFGPGSPTRKASILDRTILPERFA